MPAKKPANPFYVLLALVGAVFVVTACAYGVMAFVGAKGARISESESGLLVFLDDWGTWLLVGQVALLAVFSLAAMATDGFWTRRYEARQGPARDVADAPP